jgi:tetratricopeptide (TPR) repeat protein
MPRAVLCAALLGLWLGAGVDVHAGAEPACGEHFAFATLEDGTHVAFALLRKGAARCDASIGDVVFSRSNEVSRVLVDEGGVTYFGYRLEVERSEKASFKVSVIPLGSGIAKELRRSIPCPGCPAPRLLAPLLRYPAPRVVRDGDAFTLDLLVNPATQEKLIDLVKVSQAPIPAAMMRASATRVAEALEAVREAEAHMVSGRYPEAIQEFRKALAIHPNDATIYNELGICYQRSYRMDQAEEQYQQALRVNPAYAEAWNNLGTLDYGRRRYKEALKSYQKARSLNPKLSSIYKNMGAAYFALRRFDDGYEAYQTAYRLNPAILETPATLVVGAVAPGVVAMENYYFAKICAANGQLDSALVFLRRAIDAGFSDFDRLERDPDFVAVVKDQRYGELRQGRLSVPSPR